MNFLSKLSIRQLYLIFLGFACALTVGVFIFLLLPRIENLIQDFQKSSTKKELSLGSQLLTKHINNLCLGLSDLASLPLVVNHTMGSDTHSVDLNDFLNSYKIQGQRVATTAFDISGRPIGKNAVFNAGDMPESDFQSIINGNAAHAVRLRTNEAGNALFIAVPILYGDLPEGVLLAIIPFKLGPIFSLGQEYTNSIEISQNDTVVQNTQKRSADTDSFIEQTLDDHPSITIRYLIDDTKMQSELGRYLYSLSAISIGALLASYFALLILGRKLLISPFLRLEASENNLRAEQERLSIATDAAKIGIWDYAIDDDQLTWDNTMHQLYHGDTNATTPSVRQWLEFVHPDDRDYVGLAFKDALEKGDDLNTEFRIINKQSTLKHIKAVARSYASNGKGGNDRIIGINMDISEMRKAQEGLITRTQAIQSAEYGVIITDASKQQSIIYVNAAFTQNTGYSQSEVLGKNCRFLHQHKDTDLGQQPGLLELKAAIKEDRGCQVIVENFRKDGTRFHNKLRVSPVKNHTGKITHYVAIQDDITKDIRREKALKEATEQAKSYAKQADAANRAKSTFLATMSHEIRTPMNAIIGMTSILKNSDLNSEQVESLNIIGTSGQTLMDLIDDILDFSKIEAGNMALEEQSFSILECIENAIFMVTTSAKQKGLNLRYHIEKDTPSQIQGDSTRTRQVLMNLLSNAVKFTQQGNVTLLVKSKTLSTQSIELIFTVSDSGLGMDASTQKKLFTPFTQADTSINRKFGGSGLGLSISKSLAQLMHGDITCKSTKGLGSTFTFTAQFKYAQDSSKVFNRNNIDSFRGKKALVVDDSSIDRDFILDQLESWGFQTFIYSSMDQIDTSTLNKLNIDLLIFDINTLDKESNLNDLVTSALIENHSVLLTHSASAEQLELSDKPNTQPLSKPFRSDHFYNCIKALREGKPVSSRTSLNKSFRDDETLDSSFASEYPMRLLVVEDNPINLKVVDRLLSKLGYKAQFAENGEKGLNAVKKDTFDLVLMDVEMPVMNGIESTIQIRSLADSIHQPQIVALTANAFEEHKKQCMDAGMNAYIPKPIKAHTLKALLRNGYEKTEMNHPSQPTSKTLNAPDYECLNKRQIESITEGETDPFPMEYFLKEYGIILHEQVTKADAAIQHDDIDTIKAVIHNLLGSSSNLGMSTLSDHLKSMQDALASKEFDVQSLSFGPVLDLAKASLASYKALKWVGPDFDWNV